MTAQRSRWVTADQVGDVRSLLRESQVEFGERFSRSRFSIIRWEQHGIKFGARSARLRAWDLALVDAGKMP